jgi:hypothetical protein
MVIYPLVNIQIAIEIVDLLIKMEIFHSYVSLPEGNVFWLVLVNEDPLLPA